MFIRSTLKLFLVIHHGWHKLCARWMRSDFTPTYSHHSLKIMPEVVEILNTLTDAGFEAYVVGGGVRDLLASVRPKDFDVATDARPEQIHALFKYSRLIGRRFPLVHVRYGRKRDEFIEVSTFRAEGRGLMARWYRSVSHNNYYGTCSTDVWRRDFTINALLFDVKQQVVIDYCEGLKDIEARLIRVIGTPSVRFEEDPIRMLRAIRLASKLKFTIEAQALKALCEQRHLLAQVSPERLTLEVVKLFYTGAGVLVWELLLKYEILPIILNTLQQCLEGRQGRKVRQFMLQALSDADQRFHSNQHLSVGFLFAVLYWFPWKRHRRTLRLGRKASLRKPMRNFLDRSNIMLVLTNRCCETVIAIWELQHLMSLTHPEQSAHLYRHPKFRAAHHFLILRGVVGDLDQSRIEPWVQD